jgi:hypothetical protein
MKNERILQNLKFAKERLEYAVDDVLRCKKEIANLEAKVADTFSSNLEIEFFKVREQAVRDAQGALRACIQEAQEYGKKLAQTKIEEIAERTGVPIHIKHSRDLNMNSVYTPKSASEKWKGLDFKELEILERDSNFGGDAFKEGWYHSSVC